MKIREIKFKARCSKDSKYYGEWVEGGLVQCDDETSLIVHGVADGCTVIYHIDPNTICEYTDLKDKNGKEIWEHDILTGKPIGQCIGEVRYNRGHFGLYDINGETEFINLSNVDLIKDNVINHFKFKDTIFNSKNDV